MDTSHAEATSTAAKRILSASASSSVNYIIVDRHCAGESTATVQSAFVQSVHDKMNLTINRDQFHDNQRILRLADRQRADNMNYPS